MGADISKHKHLQGVNIEIEHRSAYKQILKEAKEGGVLRWHIIITKLGCDTKKIDGMKMIKGIRQQFGEHSRKIFFIVDSITAARDPKIRWHLFDVESLQVNMVTESLEDIITIIDTITFTLSELYQDRKVKLECPHCKLKGMSEDQLWKHFHTYHPHDVNQHGLKCPLCKFVSNSRRNFPVHLYNSHGPTGRGEVENFDNARAPELYAFSLVLVRNPKDNRYLLVQEFASSGYWLPGGRVDPGEQLTDAAIRETEEEAGVEINLTGILKIQYSPRSSYTRLRVIFLAEPKYPDLPPKSIPDYESVGATWASYEEIKSLPLRGWEPNVYATYLEEERSFP